MNNRIKIGILFLGLIVVTCYVLLDQFAPAFGFDSAPNAIEVIAKNYLSSDASSAIVVDLSIEEKDLQHIKEKRALALQRGLLVNEVDSYVPFRFLKICT